MAYETYRAPRHQKDLLRKADHNLSIPARQGNFTDTFANSHEEPSRLDFGTSVSAKEDVSSVHAIAILTMFANQR